MTPEEQWDLTFEDEQAFIDSEINAMGLEECKRTAGPYDFDTDTCQEYHDLGQWRSTLSFGYGQGPNGNLDGLTCGEGDDAELGCALTDRQPSALWLLALASLLALLRRPAHAQLR